MECNSFFDFFLGFFPYILRSNSSVFNGFAAALLHTPPCVSKKGKSHAFDPSAWPFFLPEYLVPLLNS